MNNLNELEILNKLFTQYLLWAQEVGSITSTGVDNGFTGKNKKREKYPSFVIQKSHINTSVTRLAWRTAAHVPSRIWSQNDRIIMILNVRTRTREVTDGSGHGRVVCVSVFAFKLVLNVWKLLTRLLPNLSENSKCIFRCATYTTTLKRIKYVGRSVRLRGKPRTEGFAPRFSPVFWFFWDSNFFRPAIVVFVTIRTWTFKRRDGVFDDANIIILYGTACRNKSAR